MTCELLIPAFYDLTTLADCLQNLQRHSTQVKTIIAPVAPQNAATVEHFLHERGVGMAKVTVEAAPITDIGHWLVHHLRQSNAQHLILMRHDTFVGPNWLERLQEALAARPEASMVTPLSNHFTPYRMPLIPGTDAFRVDAMVERHGHRNYPLVRFAGALLGIARERFPLAELEATLNGQQLHSMAKQLKSVNTRIVLADHVYAFHAIGAHSEAEYEWQTLLQRLLGHKWNVSQKPEQVNREVVPKQAANLFDQKAPLALKNAARETARRLKKAILRGKPDQVVKTLAQAPQALTQRQEFATTDQLNIDEINDGKGLRILYLLEKMVVSGGVFSVVQLVNEMILKRHQARIAYIDRAFETYHWKMLQRPLQFASPEALINQAPEVDVVVATHWHTAAWAAEIQARGKAKQAAYFLQDYEGWYYPEADFARRDAVRRSYAAIPNRIVKSQWLKGLLDDDGFPARKIPFGLDTGLFYKREVSEKTGLTLLSMARPSTPWRGYQNVIDTLEIVWEAHPEINIVLFGHDYLTAKRIPFPFLDMGVIDDYDALSELYSRADIFFEGSDFQGFGRLTLEAMACETACVLTDVGGVGEYARPEENCLTVPPRTPELAAKAIIRLIEDAGLRERFAKAAAAMAQNFSHKNESEQTLAYFKSLVEAE